MKRFLIVLAFCDYYRKREVENYFTSIDSTKLLLEYSSAVPKFQIFRPVLMPRSGSRFKAMRFVSWERDSAVGTGEAKDLSSLMHGPHESSIAHVQCCFLAMSRLTSLQLRYTQIFSKCFAITVTALYWFLKVGCANAILKRWYFSPIKKPKHFTELISSLDFWSFFQICLI